MSWIFEHAEEGATGEIAAMYEILRASRGKVSNILKVHSLRPSALKHHLDLYMGLMFGPGGLSRCEREMIAVVVSRANQCEYCVSHHRESLARYQRDETTLDLLCHDYRSAPLSARERALLVYAERLTKAPAQTPQEMVEAMRSAGLADGDILLANLIVAYFNFVNRIAMGLGVRFNEDEVRGYHA